MKVQLILLLAVASSCKSTDGSSHAKGVPAEDSLIMAFGTGFCEGTTPTIEYLTSKKWNCVNRQAHKGNFDTVTAEVSFKRDKTYSNVVYQEAPGWHTVAYEMIEGTLNGKATRMIFGKTYQTIDVPATTSDGTVYVAELVGTQYLPNTFVLSGVCSTWPNANQLGILSLMKCD
ncbi:MAG: hypothetical protein AB7T49_04260 [Oligoflexales bacterium]